MEKLVKASKNYMRIVLGAYLTLMLAVFPFYAPQGYVEIGVKKYQFFKGSGIFSLVMAFPAIVILAVYHIKTCAEKKKISGLSATDLALLFYGLAVFLSFFCTKWKEDAIWGAEGWYMGLFSQIMFLAICFAVSRLAENIKMWYGVLLAVSSVVFLLGLLNRFSVYPIKMEGSVPGFISTLGNINWFCSYWMVAFPIGLVLYWIGEGRGIWKKAALAAYILLGFMTGITQGSSSGFLALAAVFLAMLLLSFNDKEKLLGWLELGIMFAVSILCLSVIQSLFPEALNYENRIERWLTGYGNALGIFSVTAVLYAIACYWFRKREKPVEGIRFLQKGIIALLVFAGLTVIVLAVYYNTGVKGPEESKLASVFTIDEEWGNARGTTWRAGAESFAAMPVLQKLVGVGPDCFYLFAYSNGNIALRLYSMFGDARLTNAHNEWLTVLVNIGLFGLVSYAAIFLTAVFRQVKAGQNGKKQELALVSAVCILSYTVHNMVSFQQVICTPLIFVLIGFGEKILRTAGNPARHEA